MKCLICKADVAAGSHFCGECGTPLLRTCPACAHRNAASSKFCSECGATLTPYGSGPLPVRQRPPLSAPTAGIAEHRQLSVMFCDLVGSVTLAERLDAEDLRDLLTTYQRRATEIVEAAGGLVARYQGDGILAYFGYPVANEDDAERAIRAGLDLIKCIGELGPEGERLALRIGIATGMVIVGELVASAAADQPPIVGVTPNLAARLQAIAEPNAIVIAPSTRRLTGGLFEYADLGPRNLKGFSQAISAWKVLGESVDMSRFEALRSAHLPLIGREEEVALLLRRWAQAKSGEGRVLLVAGEAGIGKSRIASELMDRPQDGPLLRLRYFCSPHHRNSALYPFIAQMQRAAGFERADTPDQKLDKMEALISQLGVSVKEVAPLFADLLALPSDNRYLPLTPDTQRRREMTLAALIRLLEGCASGQPVLAIIEDLHWIDPSSRDLLDMIVERVPRLPLLLVMTFRPEFQPPWVGQAHVTMLALSRLAQRETARLIKRVAGNAALPDAIVSAIAARTDGIPLFVEELTKSFLESQTLRQGDARAAAMAPENLAIPSSLQASLLARLDRLGAGKEVAQIGAVLGREFSYELLDAVAARSDGQLQHSLDQLVSAGLVFRRDHQPRASYIFKHALVQDAAYSTLLRGQRKELHARIAKVLREQFSEIVELQPETLAHHYTEAGLAGPAIDYWLQAGQRAVRRSANAEAVKHLTRGIELMPQLRGQPKCVRQELAFHLALGPAMRAIKGAGAPETLAVFLRAHELLGEESTLAEQMGVHLGLFNLRYNRAELLAAREMAQKCLALAARHRHSEAMGLANRILGQSMLTMGDFSGARLHLEKSMQIYNADQTVTFSGLLYGYSDRVATESFLALALWIIGYPEQASAAAARALARAREIGHATMTAIALLGAAILGDLGADPLGAATHANELLAHCLEHGLANYVPWARYHHGAQLVRRGDAQQGIAVMQAAIREADATNAKVFRPMHLCHLAAALGSDQPEAGLGALDAAISLVERTEERAFEAELHRIRGELLLASRADGEAAMELERALMIARRQQARLWELRAATSLARAWHRQGRNAEARQLLAPVYAWFKEGQALADLHDAQALLDACGPEPA